MPFVRQVSNPPTKPLMVFDGDCGFCRRWILRFERWTRPHIDFLPSQDSEISVRFPEIPQEQFDAAVQLILPDGSVCSGAEAAFRGVAFAGRACWLLKMYERFAPFARFSEWCYQFIARHRKFFSRF